MIDYIKGTLAYMGSDHVVIENNGIGYKIFSSTNAMAHYQELGEMATFYTELVVREDAILLVGFTTRDELHLFQQLTSVSGVGTKVGIAILSYRPFDQIAQMIVNKDAKGLTGAPGVGKKTAERMILELKDKVVAYGDDLAVEASKQMVMTTDAEDALEALMALGYTKNEATSVIAGMDLTDMTTEMVIKQALRRLMG